MNHEFNDNVVRINRFQSFVPFSKVTNAINTRRQVQNIIRVQFKIVTNCLSSLFHIVTQLVATRDNKRPTVAVNMLVRFRHVIARFEGQHFAFGRYMTAINKQQVRHTERTLGVARHPTSRVNKRFGARSVPQLG